MTPQERLKRLAELLAIACLRLANEKARRLLAESSAQEPQTLLLDGQATRNVESSSHEHDDA